MKKLFLIALIICTFVAGDAYSCVFIYSGQEALEKSDEVFTGIITDVVCEDHDTQITFKTKKIWKGESAPNKVIYTSECFSNVPSTSIGSSYLIYTKLIDGKQYDAYHPSCIFGMQKIRPIILEWFSSQWERGRTGVFQLKYLFAFHTTQGEIKSLGKPIYEFK